MKVHLPISLLAAIMTVCGTVRAADLYRNLDSGSKGNWADAAWSNIPLDPGTENWLDGSAAVISVGSGGQTATLTLGSNVNASLITLESGKLLLDGTASVSNASGTPSFALGDNASLTVNRVTTTDSSTGTITLGAGAEIILGSTGSRLGGKNLNFTATGQGDGVIRVYTGTGGYSNGILNLGEATGIADVYVDGLFNWASGAKIGTANLHMSGGSSTIRGAGSYANNIYLDSTVSVRTFSNNTTTFTGTVMAENLSGSGVTLRQTDAGTLVFKGNVDLGNGIFHQTRSDLGASTQIQKAEIYADFRAGVIKTEYNTAGYGTVLTVKSGASIVLSDGFVFNDNNGSCLKVESGAQVSAKSIALGAGTHTINAGVISNGTAGTIDKITGLVSFTANGTANFSFAGTGNYEKLLNNGSGTFTFGEGSVTTVASGLTATKGIWNVASGAELYLAGSTFEGGILNVDGKVVMSGQFDTKSAFNADIRTGGYMEITDLVTFQADSNATETIKISGGTLKVTGSNNGTGSTNSILFGRFSGGNTTIIDVTDGKFEATDAVMVLARSGNSVVTVTGGELEVKGLRFNNYATSTNGKVYLGSQQDGSGSGTLKIGSEGITYLRSGAELNLGQGTVLATANWSTSANGTASTIQMTHASQGTRFDMAGFTVTINHALGGAGRLVVDDSTGTGRLELMGNIGHMGGTVINKGTLVASSLINNVTVNAGGTLIATALGSDIVINGGKLQSGGDNLVIDGGLALGAGSSFWVNKNGGGTVNSVGTMTLGGDFEMTGGDLYICFQGNLYDQIVASNVARVGSNLILESGTLNLMGVGETFDYEAAYDVFQGFAVMTEMPGINVTGYDTANWQHYWEDNTLKFQAVSIPESSSILLLGLSSLIVASRRQRKA